MSKQGFQGYVAVLLGVLLSGAPGCVRRPTAADPRPPELAAATSQTRCAVRRSADKPLVVEWPAADRAALEARAQASLVAVRYTGCTMEVLSHCEVDGSYAFVPLSRKQERVTIRDADELYARLPVGAAALEGKLEHAGELVVDMTIVGRKQADRHVFSRDELRGRCAEATHVLTGLTVGAFSMHAGARTELVAGARFASASVGAAREQARERLASDGDPLACDAIATLGEPLTSPPPTCGALLRVEAVPLVGEPLAEPLAEPTATPEEARRRPPLNRAAAWRGVGATSGVLSGAALGSLVGGVVLLYQSNSQPVWEEISPANARKKIIGTGMVIGSSIAMVGFGSLALAASAAAQRADRRHYAWVAPSIDRTTAGLQVGMRF